ncbi:MAG: TlpA family protein disulfide reductase [Acidobacteria bacterium]|nr:TlpA family protein disulfide reductase [Acidobacteriota bacterium]
MTTARHVKRSRGWLRLAAAAALVLAAGIPLKAHLQREEHGMRALPVGTKLPGIEATSIDGTTYDVASMASEQRVLVIAVWTTWCVPCRSELRELAWIEEHADPESLRVVALNVGEPRNRVIEALPDWKLPRTVLLDEDGSIAALLQIDVFPSLIVVVEGDVARVQKGSTRYLSQLIAKY